MGTMLSTLQRLLDEFREGARRAHEQAVKCLRRDDAIGYDVLTAEEKALEYAASSVVREIQEHLRKH